jgi:hypothetical protein
MLNKYHALSQKPMKGIDKDAIWPIWNVFYRLKNKKKLNYWIHGCFAIFFKRLERSIKFYAFHIQIEFTEQKQETVKLHK